MLSKRINILLRDASYMSFTNYHSLWNLYFNIEKIAQLGNLQIEVQRHLFEPNVINSEYKNLIITSGSSVSLSLNKTFFF